MSAPVDIVAVETSDGVQLEGSLRRAEAAASLGIDCLIMHHGFSGNFYRAGFFDQLSDSFAGAGAAVLRVNSRGHDFAYPTPKGPLGASYEVIDECRLDWRAWIDYAASLGYQRIGLWGQSLGAVKTVYYLAKEQDTRVVAAVTSSPPRFSYEETQKSDAGAALKGEVERAKRMIADGKGDVMLEPQVPPGFRLSSARTYLDKWGAGERNNVLRLLPVVNVPVLVTVGGLEGQTPQSSDWLQFGNYASQLEALAASTPNVTFKLIDGANHAYAGRVEALWDAASAFLRQATAAPVS
jgi:pimeloyl-ACP methyl ester carboxylesterase